MDPQNPCFVVAGTGHRPNKLGGYGENVLYKLIQVAMVHLEQLKPDLVLSGMALGWDQALAIAAHQLKIPFVAVVPFAGQESQWPQGSQELYQNLLQLAEQTVVVCDGHYAAWKMMKRNEWLVDNCDVVLALWDGSPGGTSHTVSYAQIQNRPIENAWKTWRDIG